jgi:hypothetical protein
MSERPSWMVLMPSCKYSLCVCVCVCVCVWKKNNDEDERGRRVPSQKTTLSLIQPPPPPKKFIYCALLPMTHPTLFSLLLFHCCGVCGRPVSFHCTKNTTTKTTTTTSNSQPNTYMQQVVGRNGSWQISHWESPGHGKCRMGSRSNS